MDFFMCWPRALVPPIPRVEPSCSFVPSSFWMGLLPLDTIQEWDKQVQCPLPLCSAEWSSDKPRAKGDRQPELEACLARQSLFFYFSFSQALEMTYSHCSPPSITLLIFTGDLLPNPLGFQMDRDKAILLGFVKLTWRPLRDLLVAKREQKLWVV